MLAAEDASSMFGSVVLSWRSWRWSNIRHARFCCRVHASGLHVMTLCFSVQGDNVLEQLSISLSVQRSQDQGHALQDSGFEMHSLRFPMRLQLFLRFVAVNQQNGAKGRCKAPMPEMEDPIFNAVGNCYMIMNFMKIRYAWLVCLSDEDSEDSLLDKFLPELCMNCASKQKWKSRAKRNT